MSTSRSKLISTIMTGFLDSIRIKSDSQSGVPSSLSAGHLAPNFPCKQYRLIAHCLSCVRLLLLTISCVSTPVVIATIHVTPGTYRTCCRRMLFFLLHKRTSSHPCSAERGHDFHHTLSLPCKASCSLCSGWTVPSLGVRLVWIADIAIYKPSRFTRISCRALEEVCFSGHPLPLLGKIAYASLI